MISYHPRLSIICALSENRVIGQGDRIPWHIREDLIRFKEKTLHHTVIMGRATFESVAGYYRRAGRPVPDRKHIIVTRDAGYKADLPNCYVVPSIDAALEKGREIEPEEIFVSGGASIFEQTIGKAERLYLTIVKGEFAGDKYFPDYSAFTKVIAREDRGDGKHSYTFLDLERP